jgi:hypothetical protein
MKRRADYSAHSADAEFERLAFVEGDIAGAVTELCEANPAIAPPLRPIATWLDLVAGERTRPEGRADAVRRHSEGPN